MTDHLHHDSDKGNRVVASCSKHILERAMLAPLTRREECEWIHAAFPRPLVLFLSLSFPSKTAHLLTSLSKV